MKTTLVRTSLLFATLLSGFGATSPLYINNSPVTTPPQIDATAFINRSTFDVFTTLPFQAQHVLFWTNNGIMSGTPGYRFEYDSDGRQLLGRNGRRVRRNSQHLERPSSTFNNDGTISVGSLNLIGTFSSFASTPLLFINATNVLNHGRLNGTETANVILLATNGGADLSRSGIRVGPAIDPLTITCDTTPFGSNYFLDPKVTELYWGAGRNNDLGTNGALLNLPSLLVTRPTNIFSTNIFRSGLDFSLPNPSTPFHQVISRSTFSRSLFTNLVSLPGGSFIFGGGCSGEYEAHVFTSLVNATGMAVNVVFVPTNSLIAPSNLFIDVRFDQFNAGNFGSVPAAVIEFRSVDFDIVEERLTTNYVTFVDTTGSETNVFLARPFATVGTTGTTTANTRRPSTYNLFPGRYCSFDFLEPANTPFDQNLFYNPNFATNRVSTIYAAYSAQIGQTNSSAFTGATGFTPAGVIQLGVNPGLSDPTNFTGRIEINAGRLDINNARMRAENFIGIKALDLVSNALATIDAPFINLDVRSSQPELIIANVAPDSVSRLQGRIAAWSSAWSVDVTNVTIFGTNLENIRFHVTFIDNCLQSQQPVTLHRLALTATNVVLRDNLFVNASANINASALTVASNASLNFPSGATWAFTNVQGLLNFTNDGTIAVGAAAYFGAFEAGHIPSTTPPRKRPFFRKKKKNAVVNVPQPLDNFVNRGSLSASAVFVRATNVETIGGTFRPAITVANGGIVNISADSVAVINAALGASGDVELHANDLSLANTFINAGTTNNGFNQFLRGALILDVTNSLADPAGISTNDWFVTAGVRFLTKPAVVSDLLGTRLHSAAGSLRESLIIWAGEDRGPSASGFNNNLALGRLVLDGTFGNLFRFGGVQPGSALYVDYLELRNSATNYNFALGVDPNFTIYFADANIPPDKLDNTSGGRLRWVSSFTGPQSSTNLIYPNGVTYAFNAGLIRSRDIDSDGDGIVNAQDCTPVPVPGFDTTGAQCPGGIIPPPPVEAVVSASAGSDLGLTITRMGGDEVMLRWNAAPGSVSTVDYSDSIGGGIWRPLTNFVNGTVNTRMTLKDAISAPVRVYRVHVDGAGTQ